MRAMVTEDQLEIGRLRGQLRREASRSLGLNPVSEQSGYDSGSTDDLSGLSEYLFAMHFHLPIPPTHGTFHDGPDVPPFEIRTPELKNRNLLIREDDFRPSRKTGYVPAHSPFVLVTFVSLGTYDSIQDVVFDGWIFGHEAPYVAFRTLESPGLDKAWLIRPDDLNPFDDQFMDLFDIGGGE